jgi:hypothetical protein
MMEEMPWSRRPRGQREREGKAPVAIDVIAEGSCRFQARHLDGSCVHLEHQHESTYTVTQ